MESRNVAVGFSIFKDDYGFTVFLLSLRHPLGPSPSVKGDQFIDVLIFPAVKGQNIAYSRFWDVFLAVFGMFYSRFWEVPPPFGCRNNRLTRPTAAM